MKREIINIDRDKCNGCGLCVPNCHEGALQIIDGKVCLVSELMCDGLGACIGYCPEGAITIEEREAEPYNEIAVLQKIIPQGKNVLIAHLSHMKEHNQFDFLKQGVNYLKQNADSLKFNLNEVIESVHNSGKVAEVKKEVISKNCSTSVSGGCPGSISRSFVQKDTPNKQIHESQPQESQLSNWPIQLHLINPNASYFKNAELLLSADCVSYALPDFHQKYLKGKTLVIACPKLDSNKGVYVEKLIALINEAEVKSITIMKMEVPCCGGLLQMAQIAIKEAVRKIPLQTITVGIQGDIK